MTPPEKAPLNGHNSATPIKDTDPSPKIVSTATEGHSSEAWRSIQARAEQFPKAFRGHYLRAMVGKSQRSAIRAHCLMCMGYNLAQIRECSAPACPLYPYRLKG
jgi:hypothetical protein